MDIRNQYDWFCYAIKKVLVGFIIVLCFGGHLVAEDKIYGGHMVMSMTSDPKSFNDILAKESSTSVVTSKMFEGLTTTDGANGNVLPNLASHWDISADGLVWIFYLRRDVKWFDGEKFTADDVVFTFKDLIFNKDIPNSSRDIYTIEGKEFEIIRMDDYTVKFVLPIRFAPFLKSMGQSILPEHILNESVRSKSFNFMWGIDTDPKNIIGTGPFKLVRYQPGQRIVFERNEDYWKKDKQGRFLPYINKLIYLIVQNQDVEVLKFMDRELDIITVRAMDFSLLKPIEKKKHFSIIDIGASKDMSFLFFNQNRGIHPETKKPFVDPVKLAWFTNRKFRQAIAHTIDKDKIIEIVMNGFGYPQHSSMSPSSGFFYNPYVKKYEYDLDKARMLLKSIGLQDRNGDGIIEDKKGNRVEFNLYTNSGNSQREDMTSIIQADLKKIGIKVNFLTLEFNSIVSKVISNYDWEAMVLGLTGGEEPHFGKNVWASNGSMHMWHPLQKTPATQWEQKIDNIFVKGVQEIDPHKRKKLYDKYQMIVSEELPLIYTVLNSRLYAVRNKFGNLNPNNYGGLLHNLEYIYVYPEYQ